MSDNSAPHQPAPNRSRLFITLAVAGVAVAIAAWTYLGNAAGAKECPVQAEAAATIDNAAKGELAALMGSGEGRGYKSMAFKDAGGKDMSIADFSGKALLVNFWASWCVPCREEMPALDAIATKYNSDAFMVLPINLDIGEGGLEKAKGFLDENQFKNLPLYADSSFAAFERLKREAVAVGLPVTLVLDENGCELAVLQGPAEWNSADGEAVVEALVGLKS
ncbi:Thiol:disulfide oxidoreductase TlpA [Devosia sp. LC5]|uniref:TlpA disulfide reductase family protein n=1 Tax=Devosia sp. LC5 TaxID=1502724 RepID=UPI0004E36CE8|nr:TlpA disulfide reductase family protein [Devosia sp. LC5]KFC65407.1 Thiol:disulfide oxidoreductase TlpA [Devosia sp. LC5]